MNLVDHVGQILRPVRAGARRSRLTTLPSPFTIELSSPAFADGDAMPIAHAGRGVGANVSPALSWRGVPKDTAALAFIIQDDDVPLPRPLTHTAAVLGPGIDHLDEGALAAGAPDIRFLRTLLGRGYLGPRPIPGHGTHHYRFHLIALNAAVPDDVRTVGALLHAIRTSAIARGVLTGTYQRPPRSFGSLEN